MIATTPTKKRLLTVKEAATELNSSRQTVQKLIHGNVLGVPALPSVKLGRRYLILRDTLEQYVASLEKVNSPA